MVMTLPAIIAELEVFDEVSYALELRIEELMDRGLTRAQAIEELRWVRRLA
jgi:hypothetical protein